LDQLAPVSRTQKDASIELNVSNGNAANNLVRDCFEVLLRCRKTGIFADRIAAVIRDALARDSAEDLLVVLGDLEPEFSCGDVPHPGFVRAVLDHGKTPVRSLPFIGYTKVENWRKSPRSRNPTSQADRPCRQRRSAPAGLFFIQKIARCRYEDIAPSLWEAM
jgi:hypothetical protein